jgi:hypothetical protein
MSTHKKHSAYKSMALAKEGKTKNKDGNLKNWINEKWRNLTPLTLGDNKFYECGKKSKKQIELNIPSVCRPTIKVNENTPTLAKNYNLTQIKKAISNKKKGQYIKWNLL